jgi:hypothetical protein
MDRYMYPHLGRGLRNGRNVFAMACGRWAVFMGGPNGAEEDCSRDVLCNRLVYADG